MGTSNLSTHMETSRIATVRQGEEGGCIACEHPIRAHFDATGSWVGCPNADQETTFILVPVSVKTLHTQLPTFDRRATDHADGNGNGHLRRLIRPTEATPAPARRQEDTTAPAPAPIRTLRARVTRPRYVYHCADRRTRPALTPVRGKVYDALRASPKGLVYSDLKKRTKLVHGSIQQTLNWLRNHKYVEAEVPTS